MDQDEKVGVLVKLAGSMGLSADEMLALFLVLGDGIFFVLDLLQNRTVSFPTLRGYKSVVSGAGSYVLKRLKRASCLINGVEDFVENIKKGDEVNVSGESLVALGPSQRILGERYILGKHKE
ncbi:MAG: hypothetical protein LBD78_04085 [Spirochaetaceae bacterium]|nr:hypothetical protein [Spirochaetaceae bacterium]